MLATPGSASNSVSACTTIIKIVSIVVGNEGAFFTIFGPDDSVVLFEETFPMIDVRLLEHHYHSRALITL